MKSRHSPFGSPPHALRRQGVHSDNLVLIPASQLPFKDKWQELANDLPAGSTLIVLPPQGEPRRQTLENVARQLKTKGQPVTTLPAEYLP